MSEQEALAVVSEASQSASALLEAVQSLTILSDAAYAGAGATLTGIAERVKSLEDKRVEIKAPILEAGRRIDALFKGPIEILTKARALVESARRTWYTRKQAEAEAAAELARQAAAREQARLDKLAKERAGRALAKGNEDKAAEILATVPQVPVPVFSPPEMPKTKGVSERLPIWKFRIVDASLIPRDYLCPDEKLLGQYSRAMKEKAKIPGVEFYPEAVTSVRGATW